MAKKMRSAIVAEIIAARYLFVSVDSTPDITDVDQLTIIMRYVSYTDYTQVERFLTFVEISCHTGANLANILLDFLTKYGVDIVHCHRQSYDNASNMSGKYAKMQANIKEWSAHAEYIPCAAHSLNLIGSSPVDCCVGAVTFFGVLQNLYAFFSASAKRWNLMNKAWTDNCKVANRYLILVAQLMLTPNLHSMSAMTKFQTAILHNSEEHEQSAGIHHEAKCLYDALGLLETSIMCEVWNNIRQRFNACSKSLQDAHIQLESAVSLLRSFMVSWKK